MAVIESGSGVDIAAVGAVTSSPMHVTIKATPYGALGHYAYGQVTGLMAAGLAAASDIFQFRWTDTSNLCVINEVALTGMYQTTAFTAGAGLFQLTLARAFTASGTGGTAATLTGDNQALRTSMGSSLVGDLRIATTAALGAGTKTYDAQPIGVYAKFILAAGNTQVFEEVTLFSRDPGTEHPIVLAQNEGFGIRATVPATGVWTVGIRVKWAEVPAY